jgi:hypothetical protein
MQVNVGVPGISEITQAMPALLTPDDDKPRGRPLIAAWRATLVAPAPAEARDAKALMQATKNDGRPHVVFKNKLHTSAKATQAQQKKYVAFGTRACRLWF